MQHAALMLRPCSARAIFASPHRPANCRQPLRLACSLPQPSEERRADSSPASQPRGPPAVLAALLPATAWLQQPQAAWAQALQTELPQAQALYELADLDAKTAGAVARVLQPALALAQLLMIVRIVLSWYPQVNSKKLPWSVAVLPTEWLLDPTRRLIPPVGGVDIAPIIWFAFLSFSNEILVGPQGILNLLQRKVGA